MKTLEERITALEDIEKIKVLQRTYGYYMDNHRYDDVINLFSDKAESVETDDGGVFLGKAGVRRFYEILANPVKGVKAPMEFGVHLQLQGVVHLEPDGRTAYGRWQCLMMLNVPLPDTKQAIWGAAVYENRYIKEDDIWKISKLIFNHYFMTTYEDGWAKVPVAKLGGGASIDFSPDIPAKEDRSYPSGYVLPYHFNHPVKDL